MPASGSWAWWNAFADSPLAAGLLLPLGYAVFRFGEYLIKRRVEGASESRDMDSLHSAADLKEKLARQNLSIEELRAFRERALGQSAQTAVVTAQHYIDRATYLSESRRSDSADDWPEANTQAEMTAQAAARFGIADDELTALILAKVASYTPEEAAAFQKAQDAWLDWRMSEAEWDAKVWEGGSIRSSLVCYKLEQLTRERIAAIQVSGDLERDSDSVVVTYRRAPRDLPDHIEPGITGTRVREIIGVPQYIAGHYWYYRYQETQLELHLDGEVVDEVIFAMVDGERYEAEVGTIGPLPFGELTFGMLQELVGEALDIKVRTSMRTVEIYTVIRMGPSGAWNDYYFGALMPHSGAGRLMHTEFDWEWGTDTLKEFPTNAVINWFGQANGIEPPCMSWFLK